MQNQDGPPCIRNSTHIVSDCASGPVHKIFQSPFMSPSLTHTNEYSTSRYCDRNGRLSSRSPRNTTTTTAAKLPKCGAGEGAQPALLWAEARRTSSSGARPATTRTEAEGIRHCREIQCLSDSVTTSPFLDRFKMYSRCWKTVFILRRLCSSPIIIIISDK